MTTADVAVVGGGPVGLAAAIAIRQRGFDVLVVDRAYPPIDKPCGEGLMPDGVATLNRMGIACDISRALSFHGIRFTEDGRSADGHFLSGNGIGIRRTLLHQLLIDHAARAGVTMRWGERVRVEGSGRLEIGARATPCRWIVGADGRESSVRRQIGFEPASRPRRRRIGMRQHFRVAPWSDLVEVHWHDRGQAVVTPVAPDEICVSLFANGAGARVPELIALYPELERRLRNAPPSSAARGSISGSSAMRSVVRGRVALIGDAAGAVDALTGEGLSLGFRHALALADALGGNDLERYERAHRRIKRAPELMARLMLLGGARRTVRLRVLSLLEARPRLFSFMLGIHTGTSPVGCAALSAAAGFLRHLASADSVERERQLTK